MTSAQQRKGTTILDGSREGVENPVPSLPVNRGRLKRGIRKHFERIMLLVLASYGLLYFSYKYYVPWFGGNDFADYYHIYVTPLDLHAARAPFVCRQVSAVLTFIAFRANIYYPDEISFHSPQYSQQVFFAALLINWIFLVLAAWVAGLIAEQVLGEESPLVALTAGTLCLLAFETQQAVLTGLTEGPAWLLFAVAFLAYLRKAKWTLAVILVLSIFQRETVCIAMASIAGIELILRRDDLRFRLQVIGASLACFAAYVLGRKMLVSGGEEQVQAGSVASAIFHIHINRGLVLQGIVSQSTMMILLLVLLLGRSHLQGRKIWIATMLGTLAIVDCVGLLANIGNNIGRIGALLTPALAALAAASFSPAVQTTQPPLES